MSVLPVLSTSAVGKACLSCQHDGAQHSLVKQAEAQGALAAGAVTEVQAGGASLALLHPDEGLDLSVHLELHYGLDQWPVGTAAVSSKCSLSPHGSHGWVSVPLYLFGWFSSLYPPPHANI